MPVKDLSPAVPKLLLKLLAPAAETIPRQRKTRAVQEPHVHAVRLEHILRQVGKDGFHAEYIWALGRQGMEAREIIAAVTRWAERSGIRVSINHERGIFFFEEY